MSNEVKNPSELGERVATIEGEMSHFATKDFVRQLIETQTKELNATIKAETKELQGSINAVNNKVEGIRGWQNRVSGGGAGLAIIISLIVAIGNMIVIITRLS